MLQVSDTGVGMDERELKTALMPFGQVDGSLTRKYEGTGLGLPLALALTELQQGAMEINSRKGEGTEVILRFPIERTSVET